MRLHIGPSVAAVLAVARGLAVAIAQSSEPSAQVGQIFVKSSNVNASSPILFLGETVYQCLMSMPFEAGRAVQFIGEYRKYLQFQSTLEILKDPPETDPMPGVDLMGGLGIIRKKAARNGYRSHFEFDSDLLRLLLSAHDGHLNAHLCSTSLFQFVNKVPLASVSTDGLELPQVYTWRDAILHGKGVDAVSPIVTINGEDANAPRYKIQMRSITPSFLPKRAKSQRIPMPQTGRQPRYGQEPIIPWGSKNGTNIKMDTYAKLEYDLSKFPWQNGSAMLWDVCPPFLGLNILTKPVNFNSDPLPAPSFYPKPFARDPYNTIAGYLSNCTTLQDVAVLSVPTFQSIALTESMLLPLNATATFQSTAADFLNNATRLSKKKLIIDMSGNYGGIIFTVMALIRTIFPEQPVFSATRFRAHEGTDLIGKGLARYEDTELTHALATRNVVTPDQSDGFASWSNLYGPHHLLGMKMSSPMAQGSTPLSSQKNPFAPEDIVLITDGLCSSGCSVLSKFLKAQGVRSIVFGGRPRATPMQTVGGVRGEMSYQTTNILADAKLAYQLSTESLETPQPLLTQTELGRFNGTLPVSMDDLPFNMVGTFNLLNGYAKNDNEAVMPLYSPMNPQTAGGSSQWRSIWIQSVCGRQQQAQCSMEESV